MAHELSQRQLRVGQEIRKVIATALEKGEVRSPEIAEAFITITQVIMSPDLKYATRFLFLCSNFKWYTGRKSAPGCRSE